ncbi:MAG: acetyl-CoA carboxylase biotin carboxyl carrier protein [Spirochaetaceae bacterium]|nr:acetyl-CoA carboxylase biotin carboxyl carrier protein [Spirochaetaceae bacterium]
MQEQLLITILEKFSAGSIAELDFQEGNIRLQLRKESALPKAGYSGQKPEAPRAVAAAQSAPLKSAEEQPSGAETIKSPIVATFYASPGPDAPPFAACGAAVKAGETLCILEAMKMMNHLEAEFDCEIVAVRAKSGDVVEYGQPLFEVKRR